MFGFFGIFGRSRELRGFDRALRSVDLHPMLVPEAVKLTAVRLVGPQPDGYEPAATILAYCMTGADAFASANGHEAADAVERRIEAALEAGDSLDAQLVLLALHARVIQPSVVERFGLSAD